MVDRRIFKIILDIKINSLVTGHSRICMGINELKS